MSANPNAANHRRARNDMLDVLRGFAILGIFLINLPFMTSGEIDFAAMASGTALDRIAQTFTDLYFEGTQRGLLQLLFGAGMVILTSKAVSPDGPVSVADTYIRRNLWLILFGLLHIFVVRWGFDILHLYGLAALFLFTFRNLSAPAALALGVGISVAWQWIPMGGEMPAPEGTEDAAKSFLSGMNAVEMWLETVSGLNLWATVAEAFATMLIGVALFKWGVIQGLKSRRFYVGLTVLGYGVGLALRVHALGDPAHAAEGPSPSDLGRIIMTIGHVGLLNLLWQNRIGAGLLSPLRAAGRTAFTLYVMQSVIGIWILWASWGPLTTLDLGSAGVLGTAGLVLAFQVVLANIWLRWYDSGPLEMLWRRLVRLTSPAP